jgi:hypothetical protein
MERRLRAAQVTDAGLGGGPLPFIDRESQAVFEDEAQRFAPVSGELRCQVARPKGVYIWFSRQFRHAAVRIQ